MIVPLQRAELNEQLAEESARSGVVGLPAIERERVEFVEEEKARRVAARGLERGAETTLGFAGPFGEAGRGAELEEIAVWG